MRSLKILGIIFLCLLITYIAFMLSAGLAENDDKNTLSFSNTAEWDPVWLARAEGVFQLNVDWESITSIPPPPENTSTETEKDIQTIISYKMLRTEEATRSITQEIDFDTIMGGYPVLSYFDPSQFPHTALLLTDSFYDMTTLVMKWKLRFDRVRPHILEPSIEPIINVPGHPAYPSGHATQAYFIAYIMSELRPKDTEELLADAARIAKNREIAGVHYPSDSEAGRLIARQFVDELLRMSSITKLWENARNEWQ